MRERQAVVQQVGDVGFEVIEQGEGVLADRDQDIDEEAIAPKQPWQLRREPAVRLVAAGIFEEILELVEDEEEIAIETVALAPGGNHLRERVRGFEWCAGLSADGLEAVLDLVGQFEHRVALPELEVDSDEFGVAKLLLFAAGQVAETRRHASAEQRCLTRATGPVQDGESGGAQVI